MSTLAYAKALEELTGATVSKMLNIPNSAFSETKKWEELGPGKGATTPAPVIRVVAPEKTRCQGRFGCVRTLGSERCDFTLDLT